MIICEDLYRFRLNIRRVVGDKFGIDTHGRWITSAIILRAIGAMSFPVKNPATMNIMRPKFGTPQRKRMWPSLFHLLNL
jgi:hypothetical protein